MWYLIVGLSGVVVGAIGMYVHKAYVVRKLTEAKEYAERKRKEAEAKLDELKDRLG